MFGSLDIGIWNLFEIWCLEFGISQTPVFRNSSLSSPAKPLEFDPRMARVFCAKINRSLITTRLLYQDQRNIKDFQRILITIKALSAALPSVAPRRLASHALLVIKTTG